MPHPKGGARRETPRRRRRGSCGGLPTLAALALGGDLIGFVPEVQLPEVRRRGPAEEERSDLQGLEIPPLPRYGRINRDAVAQRGVLPRLHDGVAIVHVLLA